MVKESFEHVLYIFSNELRELEAMLKMAYMNKERQAQLAEKEAHKYDKMVKNGNKWNSSSFQWKAKDVVSAIVKAYLVTGLKVM